MDLQTFITAMAVIVVAMAWYANTSKRNKILCSFRRVNKTKINKWVKMQSRYVVFDGGRYDIRPRRVTWLWYCQGIIHMIFPQWVPTLDYSWTSRFPHDPDNMDVTAESPEVRKALNKEEWVKSYYRGAKPTTATRQNIITQYLPWIAIILVFVVGVYLYNNMQAMNIQMQAIQQSLNAIR